MLLGLTAVIAFAIAFVLFLEQAPIVPVAKAGKHDWNPEAFWNKRWGESGVHKGIDVFAKRGTPVVAAVAGLVIYQRTRRFGGRVILILGPGGLTHYYAHLETVAVSAFDFVAQGELIGTVGTSGNANPKVPHLHYSVMSLIPDFDRYEDDANGVARMFYRDPHQYLTAN